MAAAQNLGPLTAAAALPSSCVGEPDIVYKVHITPEGYFYLLNGPIEVASCYPSSYDGTGTEFHSPAPSCPSGFTPACSNTNAAGTVIETIQTCCPTHFNYSCQTEASYAWESTLGCVSTVDRALSTTWTVIDIESGNTKTSTSTGYQDGMNAYSIQVRFQSKDLVTTTSSESGSETANAKTPSTTPISTGISSPTSSASQSSTPTSAAVSAPNSGSSAGAAAGIGVGSLALSLASAGAVIFMINRRRK
ncbi:putative Mid2 domain-containing protein [Seiridium unicorne]|uniref:Mid2 domain-containing protein n=1 Tax=Seiridium unicorne TaxID=138068 RepID=A0ABR2UI72_9PEZI